MTVEQSSNPTDLLHFIEEESFSIQIKPEMPPFKINFNYLMNIFNIPGLSIAIIDNFEVVAAKGYGYIENGSSIKITTSTLFQAGSVSKTITAVGALNLVGQKKLSLDEDVNNKFKSWSLSDEKFTKKEKVTLRRLLSHTAGLTVHGFPGYRFNSEIPSLIQVLDGVKPANTPPVKVKFVPGTKWSYSGGGYLIVQQLMIDTLESSFPDIMRKLVFDKIQMTRSTFEQPPSLSLQSQAAHGSSVTGVSIPGNWHIYPEMAAGGLWTTPTDLAKFFIEIALSKQGKSNKLIDQKMTKEMFKIHSNNVTEFPFGNNEFPDRMGLGVFLGDITQPNIFGHIGDTEGFQSSVIMDSKSGKGVVIMSNSPFGILMGDYVINIISKQYNWENYHRSNRIWIGFGALLYDITEKKGIEYVLDNYHIISSKIESIYKPDENALIQFAYFLLGKGKPLDALAVMKFQVQTYPDFWNSYDSIGEIYMILGKNDLAIKNIEKSLELNPDNTFGLEKLQKLKNIIHFSQK